MSVVNGLIIAAKCAPEEKILSDIVKADLKATELYLSKAVMRDLGAIIKICKSFPLKYAVHAPNDCYNPKELAELASAIGAEIVVFHNIYWDNEWEEIIGNFKGVKTKLCLENTYSVHEPLKFIRRYGLGRCLDLEHLQMECAGVYEEEFKKCINQSDHIHLTGYIYGSRLWHSHIHHSKEHALYILNLVKEAGYSGLIVSEAKLSLQTYEDFKKLYDLNRLWLSNNVKDK